MDRVMKILSSVGTLVLGICMILLHVQEFFLYMGIAILTISALWIGYHIGKPASVFLSDVPRGRYYVNGWWYTLQYDTTASTGFVSSSILEMRSYILGLPARLYYVNVDTAFRDQIKNARAGTWVRFMYTGNDAPRPYLKSSKAPMQSPIHF